jgi:kynurenine formamidase
MIKPIICCVLFIAINQQAFCLDLAEHRLVDLSHSYSSETLYWPTSPTRFEKNELAFGTSEGGWFYSSFSVCTPEHGGTHLDAPLHFAEGGLATDEIPLENLIAPAVVIDISQQSAANRDYRLTVEDVLAHEKTHGKIEPGSIVLLRTGWSRYWPDALAYLGDDTPGDASRLRFPAYGAEAARLLVTSRDVSFLGVDTASIDYGKTKDFIVHQIASTRGVGGLENLTGLEHLPPNGFHIIALPMKIQGGSGGPVRVVAVIPK